MKQTLWLALAFAFLFVGMSITEAQNYNMSNTTINTCSGNFFDSGGNGLLIFRYKANENLTTTICPDKPGASTILQFADVDLGKGDVLCFYDGKSVADTLLLCTSEFPGKVPASLLIQATETNVSGCVTVKFKSDASIQGNGWAAAISCKPSCQRIEAVILNTTPATVPVDTGWVNICPKTEISFNATAKFPQNNIKYAQSENAVKYEWDFSDGNVETGRTMKHAFKESGGYNVRLTVIDQYGCKNTNEEWVRVRVAPKPQFTIGSLPKELCMNDTISLRGVVNLVNTTLAISAIPTVADFLPKGIRSDSLALPDGDGNTYTTSVRFTQFASTQTMKSANDIKKICINLEHSWARDMEISIKCPSGKKAVLHNHAGERGGEVILGTPYELDDDSNPVVPKPGLGEMYCWTPSATNPTWIDYANKYFGIAPAGTRNHLPPGDYQSYQKFSNLIGCPLNGDWQLTVRDLWSEDNGYIFSWGIQFDRSLYPKVETFSPKIVSSGWTKDSPAARQSGNDITAQPNNAGTARYIFQTVDDYTCAFDTAIQFNVLPATHPNCYKCNNNYADIKNAAICTGDKLPLDATYSGKAAFNIGFEAHPNYAVGYGNHPGRNEYEAKLDVNSLFPIKMIDAKRDLASVCVDLETDKTEDIVLRLRSPDGKYIVLTAYQGKKGKNYTRTCFKPSATTSIKAGTAPFTGDFQPWEDWKLLDYADMNGTWKLLVSDSAGFDKMGLLKSWSMSFNATNAATYEWSPATTLTCKDCPKPIASPLKTVTYRLTASDSYNCKYTDTAKITVSRNFTQPTIRSKAFKKGKIIFDWDAMQDAEAYEININGVGWIKPNGALSHTVSNATYGTSHKAQLRVRQPDGVTCTSEIANNAMIYNICDINTTLNSSKDATCFGATDGVVGLKVENGISPYVYTIEGSTRVENKPNIDKLAAGKYRIIIIDNVNCKDTFSVEVKQPTEILVDVKVDSVSCKGFSTGKAVATATGGAGTFSYLWTATGFPSVLAATAPNLKAGKYTLLVKDKNSCETLKEAQVFEPKDALTAVLKPDSVICNGGATGGVKTTIFGGTKPYLYNWSNSSTTQDLTNTKKGQYDLTLTDAHGCKVNQSVTVDEPKSIELTPTKENVSCFGLNDGKISVIAVGGRPTYTFIWSDVSLPSDTKQNKLKAGTYAVTVQDSKGCRGITQNLEVTQPAQIKLTPDVTDARCFDTKNGIAGVKVAGGNAPFAYQWNVAGQTSRTINNVSKGKYTVSVTDAKKCTDTLSVSVGAPTELLLKTDFKGTPCFDVEKGEATAIVTGGAGNVLIKWSNGVIGDKISNLKVGKYSVTVTDAQGCSVRDSFPINAPPLLKIDTIAASNITCNNAANGSAYIRVKGGALPYKYLWNDANAQIRDTAKALIPGIYKVIVTDVNGCNKNASITLTQPTALKIVLKTTDVSCFGGDNGKIQATISGGVRGYKYIWTNNQTDSTSTILKKGKYTLTVTDKNKCTATQEAEINQPLVALVSDAMQTKIGCFAAKDGKATVATTGGTSPYRYTWSDGQVTEEATKLDSIAYTVITADANGCKQLDTVKIVQLDAIKMNLAYVKPTCFGSKDGQIGINIITGGVGKSNPKNYTYLWSNQQASDVVTNLVGDLTYTVIATDKQGCTGRAETKLPQPQDIKIRLEPKSVQCFGTNTGEINVAQVIGDNPVKSYSWSNNAQNATTQFIKKLISDTYTVTVTDEKGCEGKASLLLPEPQRLAATPKLKINTCFGDNTGAITLAATGGTPNYTYKWAGNKSGEINNALKAGTYSFTVTDNNACIFMDSVVLAQPKAIEAEVSTTDVTCYGENSGTMVVRPVGGTPPYLYNLANKTFSDNFSFISLKAGSYNVKIKDKNGCLLDKSFAVKEPVPVELSIIGKRSIRLGEISNLSLSVKNGITKDSFSVEQIPVTLTLADPINKDVSEFKIASVSWNDPLTKTLSCLDCATPNAKPQSGVAYEVILKDEKGCKLKANIQITVQKERGILVPTAFSPDENGSNDALLVHGLPDVKIKTFRIFDRWGELLFEAKDFGINTNTGWDGNFRGQPAMTGTYIWVVEAEYPDGEKAMAKGETMLFR
jgi:gliding motility-associated-like protein